MGTQPASNPGMGTAATQKSDYAEVGAPRERRRKRITKQVTDVPTSPNVL